LNKVIRYMAVLLILFIFIGCSEETKNTPRSDILIIDNAGVIKFTSGVTEQYRKYNNYLLETFDIDFRVLTTESEQDINSFTNEAYEDFKQESRSTSGRALLLVINTRLDEVRMGVSMALEPIYTDAFVSYIERKGMVPFFRDSNVSDGVYMMMELVKDRAMEADQGKEFMEPMKTEHLGGGARTSALIGKKDKTAKQGKNIYAKESDTPEDILAKHVMSLKTHNKNPNLDIYSKATQKFFKTRTVTDIDQNHEYNSITRCHDGKVIYSEDGIHAVLLHPIEQRTCCPYLFVREKGKWRLDIFTMAKVIRFNVKMQWHFSQQDREKFNGPYEFVFKRFDYDINGFPNIKHVKKKKINPWVFECRDCNLPGDPPGKIRCKVSWVAQDGPAKNKLGLKTDDIIVGIGDGEDFIDAPNLFRTLWYFHSVKPGKTAVVTIIRDGNKRHRLTGVAQ